jgi:hypothetical protein
MKTLFVTLITGLASVSAHAYIAGPGVVGKLKAVVGGTLVCMDKNTRVVSETSGLIGTGSYIGVITNVKEFKIVSVDVLQHLVSISSTRVDGKDSLCRIDINKEEFEMKTELTDYQA